MSRHKTASLLGLLLVALVMIYLSVPAASAPQAASSSAGLVTVVLDPAHGGADPGARGASGIIEKDVVLTLARSLAAQLERQGLRVVFTRPGDENPGINERAAIANAQRGAIFISLHAGSTGVPGTALAYFFSGEMEADSSPGRGGLLRWNSAQGPFREQSRRLSELVQVQIGQKLKGSQEVPQAAAVRQLRHITLPAVAIELSSVSVADRKSLDTALPPLADAIAQGVVTFRPLFSPVNF